jgi:transcriptional regulator
MYLPLQFNKSQDRTLAARIVREHPFASLISNDDSGFPYATPLPLHLVEDGGSYSATSPSLIPIGNIWPLAPKPW